MRRLRPHIFTWAAFLLLIACLLAWLAIPPAGPVHAQIVRNADQVLNAVYDPTRTALAVEMTYASNTDFSAVNATATRTSTAFQYSELFKQVELYLTWSGITGSPAGCTIQPQASGDATTYIASGTAISVTPATNQVALFTGALGTSINYVYACSTYPSAGTLTLKTIFK